MAGASLGVPDVPLDSFPLPPGGSQGFSQAGLGNVIPPVSSGSNLGSPPSRAGSGQLQWTAPRRKDARATSPDPFDLKEKLHSELPSACLHSSSYSYGWAHPPWGAEPILSSNIHILILSVTPPELMAIGGWWEVLPCGSAQRSGATLTLLLEQHRSVCPSPAPSFPPSWTRPPRCNTPFPTGTSAMYSTAFTPFHFISCNTFLNLLYDSIQTHSPDKGCTLCSGLCAITLGCFFYPLS